MMLGCQFIEQEQVTASFQGLVVKLKANVPAEALEYSEETWQGLLEQKVAAKGRSLNDAVFSMDTLQSQYDSIVSAGTYPDFVKLWNLDEAEITKIKADFPEASTEDLKKNMPQVIAFYEKQLAYSIFTAYFEAPESVSRAGTYPGNTNSQEFLLLVLHAAWIPGSIEATNLAKAWAEELYNGATDSGRRGDAYRHCAWNVLLCSKIAPGWKADRLWWAKEFTDAHENYSPVPSDVRDNPMDFHNNAIGRNWYNQNSSEAGLTVASPSDAQIKAGIKVKADGTFYFTKNDQLRWLGDTLAFYIQ